MENILQSKHANNSVKLFIFLSFKKTICVNKYFLKFNLVIWACDRLATIIKNFLPQAVVPNVMQFDLGGRAIRE